VCNQKATLQFLKRICLSAKRLGITADFLAKLLVTAEDVEFAPGDYYCCPPPDFKLGAANHSLTGPQHNLSAPTVPLSTQQGIHSLSPGISVPMHATPVTSQPLYKLSPYTVAPQTTTVPTPLPKSWHHYPELAFKPMGPVGHCPIPTSKLQALHPIFNPDIRENTNMQPFQLPPIPAYNADLEALILSLMPNTVENVAAEDLTIPLYHGTAFAIPKPSSNKLSLIINLAAWNKSQHYKPPKFKLPSIYTMRDKLFKLHLTDTPVYFSKWDLSNFYWSLKSDLKFRFPLPRADGTVTLCQLPCLPFGWDKSPWLGQGVHQDIVDGIQL